MPLAPSTSARRGPMPFTYCTEVESSNIPSDVSRRQESAFGIWHLASDVSRSCEGRTLLSDAFDFAFHRLILMYAAKTTAAGEITSKRQFQRRRTRVSDPHT